jgi:Lrp/AsnC family leucine-responsive transcriptional regulator
MTKLDLKDWKILYELDRNSRQSFKDLAKKVGLSKDSVFYRVKRLQKTGVIKRFHTLVNIGKLGYMSFRFFLKLHNTSSRKEKEILNYLMSQRRVGWMVSVEGNWDINVWLVCKSIKELDDFWRDFYDRYANYIENKWLSIFTEIIYYPRACFLPNLKNHNHFTFVTQPSETHVDRIDFEILKLLVLDSRTPIIEIANKLGLSTKTVSQRIRKLERTKVIAGYVTMIDLEKIGYLYYRMHIRLHNVDKAKEEEFRTFAYHHPNIVYDHRSLGGPDLEIDIHVESVERLREIIKEIRDKFVSIIRDYEILQYYKEHKYFTLPVER